MIHVTKPEAQWLLEAKVSNERIAELETASRKNRVFEDELRDSLEYAENIIETIREPLVVLNSQLKITTANRSFYNTFKVTPSETIGHFLYDLGNRQWDIPKLRVLFEKILPKNTAFNDYEVEHDFPKIGRRIIRLNARQIFRKNVASHIILLAMEDITIRKQAEKALLHNNTHDCLTGLYNRAFFYAELERFSHGRMFPISIVTADINGLKKINDTQGHAAGDQMIRLAARLILAAFRAEDVVARIGGDEFAIHLPKTKLQIARLAVEKITTSPDIISGHIGIAFGLAMAENAQELKNILRLSDERMYQDKISQKNILDKKTMLPAPAGNCSS